MVKIKWTDISSCRTIVEGYRNETAWTSSDSRMDSMDCGYLTRLSLHRCIKLLISIKVDKVLKSP